MRILIVTQYFWPENFRINDLVNGLKDRGHVVEVLTGKPNYPEGKLYNGYSFWNKTIELYNGVKVYRVPLIPRGRGGSVRLFLNYLSFAFFASLLGPMLCKGKYDAVFVFEVSPITVGIPAIILKKIKRMPLFFWVLDLWPESLSSSGKMKSETILNLVKILVRYIYRNSDKILVSSKGFISSIKNISPESNSIDYFPNFVEEAINNNDIYAVKKDLYNFPKGFKIIFAGNIGYSQSFPTILSAVEKLKKYRDINWIILGDGRMAQWVKDEIDNKGLNSIVHLPGRYPQEAMPYFFSHADALLVSLNKEPNFELTVPGKIQSYLASGKPIIASIDGEGAYLISEANAGVACPAEDADALAAAVLKLYNMDKQELTILGKNGQKYCAENFNRDDLFDKLEKWLEDYVSV